jgi:cytochrome P450
VIGSNRTPNFDDEPHLPYIRALVKEVLRWRPVAVLGGTPHASTEDDWYEGYYIPSGTTILGNTWAINLNEEYYPNPHLFEPMRFLKTAEEKGNLKGRAHPAKAGHSSFGWGRRICPGADLAANSLFIALAKSLWAFEIVPKDGVVYDTFAYTEGFNIRPKKFECVISIRSEKHREVLEREKLDAERVLEKFGAFKE